MTPSVFPHRAHIFTIASAGIVASCMSAESAGDRVLRLDAEQSRGGHDGVRAEMKWTCSFCCGFNGERLECDYYATRAMLS